MSETVSRPDRTVPVLVASTSATAFVLLWWAGSVLVDSSRSPSPLAGVGYLLAAMAGAPAVIGLLLAGVALALRHRSPSRARTFSWLGLACVLLPVLVLLYLWVPAWTF